MAMPAVSRLTPRQKSLFDDASAMRRACANLGPQRTGIIIRKVFVIIFMPSMRQAH